MSSDQFDRRDFLKRTGTLGAGVAAAGTSFAKANKANNKLNPSRVIGANDRINVALIGCGGPGPVGRSLLY